MPRTISFSAASWPTWKGVSPLSPGAMAADAHTGDDTQAASQFHDRNSRS